MQLGPCLRIMASAVARVLPSGAVRVYGTLPPAAVTAKAGGVVAMPLEYIRFVAEEANALVAVGKLANAIGTAAVGTK